MPNFSLIPTLAAALIASQVASANPLPSNAKANLVARFAENYVGCTEAQETKLKQGFGDAAQMSRWMWDNFNGDGPHWSRYFRTGDGKAEDERYAKSWYSAIASNNDPTEPSYKFSVRCGKDTDDSCKDGLSLGVTDAKPQDGDTDREMLICPLYFKTDSKQTNHDLSSRKFEKPTRGQDNSWCVTNTFTWYEIGGLTLLHEMTHLDAVGKAADMPETQIDDSDGKPWFKTHGSEDVGGFGPNYPVAARKLAELWQKGGATEQTLKPFQNAESVAAAALEFYMRDRCQKAGYEIDITI